MPKRFLKKQFKNRLGFRTSDHFRGKVFKSTKKPKFAKKWGIMRTGQEKPGFFKSNAKKSKKEGCF